MPVTEKKKMDYCEKIRNLTVAARNVRSGQPPSQIQPDGVIALKENERLYFKIGGVYLYEGQSIRTGKGIAITVGKGSAKAGRRGNALDTGSLYLTDKRVVFLGINQAATIPLEFIMASTHFADGILISGDRWTTPILAINSAAEPIYWDSFNAILEALVRGRREPVGDLSEADV
ncbi:MAG: hypothetical protein WBZ29_04460 [Methanocella sp.]